MTTSTVRFNSTFTVGTFRTGSACGRSTVEGTVDSCVPSRIAMDLSRVRTVNSRVPT
jgi:hypothetical protein